MTGKRARRLLSRRRLARRHNRRAEEHAPEASPALPPPGDLGVSLLPPSARLEAGSPLRAPARHHAEGHQELRRERRRGREHRDRRGDGDVRRRAAPGVLPLGVAELSGKKAEYRKVGFANPHRRDDRSARAVSKRRSTRRRRLRRAMFVSFFSSLGGAVRAPSVLAASPSTRHTHDTTRSRISTGERARESVFSAERELDGAVRAHHKTDEDRRGA